MVAGHLVAALVQSVPQPKMKPLLDCLTGLCAILGIGQRNSLTAVALRLSDLTFTLSYTNSSGESFI